VTSAGAKARLELEPVRPLALKERVIRQLTKLIEGGVLEPGDQLPSERELSEELQVSRGTVREAVQFLQALGLVEIRHGTGTFVRPATDLKVAEPDVTALIAADLAFHHALCASAGNAALSEFADALGEQLVRERGTIWNIPGRPARSLVEHREICDAVRDGDAERARHAVLQHLESVEGDLGASILSPRETTKKG
jgi:DNA-binding FadR family transcriptional regulator